MSLELLPPSSSLTNFRIVDHGTIEPGRPARKYQYQLLDPRDDPYATFRFYCRSQEYLRRHAILDVDQSSTSSSLDTPTSGYFDAPSSAITQQDSELEHTTQPFSTPTKQTIHIHDARESPATKNLTPKSPTKTQAPRAEALSVVKIRGSLEDLLSAVPRSPQSARSPGHSSRESVPPSPTRKSSPLLPEALQILKIPKKRSPEKEIDQTKSTASILASQDHAARRLPPPKFNIGSTNTTSTGSPTPTRPSRQYHRPSHLISAPALSSSGPAPAPDQPLESRDRQRLSPRRSLSPFTPSGLLRKISSASVLRSQRVITPNMAPAIVPTVTEVDNAMRTLSDRGEVEAGRDGDIDANNPAGDESGSTPRSMKQICSLWSAGRSGWTRRQKAEEE